MAEGAARVQPERSQLLRQLRSLLPRLADPLEIVAEQILGLDSLIDFVAKDRRGQVVLVVLADRGSDLRALADCLAQRSWVEPGELWLALQLGLRRARRSLWRPNSARAIAAAEASETVIVWDLPPHPGRGSVEVLVDLLNPRKLDPGREARRLAISNRPPPGGLRRLSPSQRGERA
jgi:hypothetical protein